MQFSVMQTDLSDRLGAYDSTVAADLTKIKRWLNLGQQYITGKYNWPFMLYHEIIQTIADITTGTVSINAASTSLTFSSGPAASVTDYFIKFSSESNWYKIASHTAASTSATITPAYGGSSNLSAATYTLRKLFYATSTPLDSILDIKKTASGRFLESASSRDTDVFLPLYWDSGEVYKYISSIPGSDGGLRVSLLYSPSSVENLQVRGIKPVADMSSDSDVPLIPTRWQGAIIDYAEHLGLRTLDDTRSKEALLDCEQRIADMISTYDSDLGRHRVARSLNEGVSEGPQYTLPPEYGVSQ